MKIPRQARFPIIGMTLLTAGCGPVRWDMIGERRRAALTFASLTTALAFLCGWLLYDSLSTLLADMRVAAPAIRVDTGVAAMAILLPIITGFAVLGFVALFQSADAVAVPSKIVIVAALVALPLAMAAPWIFQSWAENALLARGYVRCEPRGRPTRFPSPTFARAPSLCDTMRD